MTNATILSPNEYIIMTLMWSENKPMTRAEILNGTPDRNWNPASVHLILNSMLSKGFIKITDESVKYGRTYEALVAYEDYVMMVLKANFPDKSENEILNDLIKILVKLDKN